jgi:tetratricopeptide (TPR) repeat protein
MKEKEKVIQEILGNINSGIFDQAMILCDRLLGKDDKDWYLHALRGTINSELENYDEAITDFDLALVTCPSPKSIFFFRGKANSTKGAIDDAICDYSKSIEIEPSWDAYFCRGLILKNKKEYEKAINDFMESLKYKPENGDAYYHIGLCYYYQNKYLEAKKNMQLAVKYSPEDPDCVYNLAIIEDKLGNEDSAITQYSQSIKINPCNYDAFYNRALLYLKKNNIEKFLEDLDIIRKKSNDLELIKEIEEKYQSYFNKSKY